MQRVEAIKQHIACYFSSCNAGGKALGCPPTSQKLGALLWPGPCQPPTDVSLFSHVALPTAGHKNAVLEVHWTTDGERILSASPDKSVRAWDARTGEQVKKMAEHDNFVNSCCPLKRGPPLLCSGADDGNVKVRSWQGRFTVDCEHLRSLLLADFWWPLHSCRRAAASSVGGPDCAQRAGCMSGGHLRSLLNRTVPACPQD